MESFNLSVEEIDELIKEKIIKVLHIKYEGYEDNLANQKDAIEFFNNTSKCPTNERFTHSYYTDEGEQEEEGKDEQKDKAKELMEQSKTNPGKSMKAGGPGAGGPSGAGAGGPDAGGLDPYFGYLANVQEDKFKNERNM